MTEYIGLYADKELTIPVSRKLVDDKWVWALDFGHLDAGEERTFAFFLENQSLGTIHDLEINVITIKEKKGVHVEVYRDRVSRLGVTDVHEFHVYWEVSEDVRAGRCWVNLEIKGMITEEED